MWTHKDTQYRRMICTVPDGRKALVLEDLDSNGNVTLTNNMDAVLKHEKQRLKEEYRGSQYELKNMVIIYQDTDGVYDGVDWFDEQQHADFYPIGFRTLKPALKKAVLSRPRL